MPTVGDILRVPVRWADPNGGQVFNIFHFALDEINVNTWEAVGDELKLWFIAGYENWMDQVTTDWNSEAFEILVRDEVGGQWNQVYSDGMDDIEGQFPGESSAPLSVATFVSYPGSVRHWGFKNLPSPAVSSINGGELDAAAFVDLLTTALLLSSGVIGIDAVLRVGVYALATETFRGFTGQVAAGTPTGSRVTRKVGRGI